MTLAAPSAAPAQVARKAEATAAGRLVRAGSPLERLVAAAVALAGAVGVAVLVVASGSLSGAAASATALAAAALSLTVTAWLLRRTIRHRTIARAVAVGGDSEADPAA